MMEESEVKPMKILTLKELSSLDRKVRKNKKIIVDLSGTKYNVIWDVMEKHFQWECVTHLTEDWNLLWNDTYITEDELRRMLPFQKINHFPGSYHLGRKNELGKNLRSMKKLYPEDYNFFPKTWLLPHQSEELRQHHLQNKLNKPVYIIKPEASCQGRGIFLSKKIDALITGDKRFVVQEYIKNPLLIDGLKFDLRIYVLLKSVNPLKVFMYQEGLGRLATKAYVKPSKKNMNNMCMHLTNYAVNKRSKDFVFNQGDDSVGHKRSLSAVLIHLAKEGHDVHKILMDIRQVIVKTLCSVQPYLSHIYRSCQPRDDQNEQCFEVFGFDVMFDDQLKPWLLEVNHTPSFSTDTQLDLEIKRSLITDTLTLINVKNKLKKQFYEQKRAQTYVKPQKKSQEERDQYTKKLDQFEKSNLNGYIKIYPAEDDPTKYEAYMDSARQLLDEWAGTIKQPQKKSTCGSIPLPQVSVSRKASLPQKDVILNTMKRPQSSSQPGASQTTPRPSSTQPKTSPCNDHQQLITQQENDQPNNSSISVPEMADGDSNHSHSQDYFQNQRIQLNLARPRIQYEFKALPPKPMSANLASIVRNAKEKRQSLALQQQWMGNDSNAAQVLHGIEAMNTNFERLVEKNAQSLKQQLKTTLSQKQLKVKHGTNYLATKDTYISPKINSNLVGRKTEGTTNNESFKIKKISMVPIKNFNFQDKLNNLLNIKNE